ncbi:MAG: hypothetical protein JXA68_08305 [Ignavibacteriales bacterium]|nr:hypothetical protein [Ignavibacteriales bacterium]
MNRLSIILLVFLLSISINAQKQKPTLEQMDSTKYYIDLNGNGLIDDGERIFARIEIEDLGFDKFNSFSKKTYYLNFILINNGDLDISNATVTIEWLNSDNSKLLYSQNEDIVKITDQPLKSQEKKTKLVEFPTYIEGFSDDIVRVNAYLTVNGYKNKLFENFIMLKKEYITLITNYIKLDILRKGVGEEISSNKETILVGRMDYQLMNISRKLIETPIIIRTVWKNADSGELFNTTEDYVLTFSDTLEAGAIRTGTLSTGKGFTKVTKFPFNLQADIYILDGEEEFLLYNDIKINYKKE